MKRLFLFVTSFLLIANAPVSAADFGFGIPDMVEEKVDELDQEVRDFKAAQPLLDELRESSIAVSSDTRDVIASSVITGRPLNNRILVALDVNRDSEGIALFQSDGEGKRLSSLTLARSNSFGPPSFEQLSTDPSDQFVDTLINIPTELGPQGFYIRVTADNQFSSVPGFGPGGDGGVLIGLTGNRGGSDVTNVDTAVEVNTFSYDDIENDLYFSGDSGVFKVFTASDGGVAPSTWNNKFQGEFRVPEDNLVIKGDTIYVTALEPDGSGTKDIFLKKIAADSELAQTDTIATSVSNPQTSLLGGEDHLFLHYHGSGNDYIYKRNYDDITRGDSRSHDRSSHFILKIAGNSNLYAKGTGGKVYSFTKSDLSFVKEKTVSDSEVTIGFQGRSGELYVGTRESDEASVIAVDQDLSDSTAVFPAPGQVINREVCQNVADNSVFTRPLWLKRKFIGIAYSGSCIGWTDQETRSRMLMDSGWPHEDANNQRQRRPQN